jgi:hypothetical protein
MGSQFDKVLPFIRKAVGVSFTRAYEQVISDIGNRDAKLNKNVIDDAEQQISSAKFIKV